MLSCSGMPRLLTRKPWSTQKIWGMGDYFFLPLAFLGVLFEVLLVYYFPLQASSSDCQRKNVTYSARLGKHQGMIIYTVCFKATLKELVVDWLGTDRYVFERWVWAIFSHLGCAWCFFWWSIACGRIFLKSNTGPGYYKTLAFFIMAPMGKLPLPPPKKKNGSSLNRLLMPIVSYSEHVCYKPQLDKSRLEVSRWVLFHSWSMFIYLFFLRSRSKKHS